MIDLEILNKIKAGFLEVGDLEVRHKLYILPSDFIELIQALSEAKEIIEDHRVTFPAKQIWLSRYFPDTRKEV